MGRKRYLLFDTPGLVIVAVVHPAYEPRRDGKRDILQRIQPHAERVQQVSADMVISAI